MSEGFVYGPRVLKLKTDLCFKVGPQRLLHVNTVLEESMDSQK
jgi:hypothetical protein